MSAPPPSLQLNALPLDVVEWAGETWDVVRRLGSGKFAVVAEVRCRAPPHALLAAKMIDTSLISPWAQHQLKVEVEVWKTLEHPHICKLHGSVTAGRHLVLLLELAAGGELFERIMAWDDFKEETAVRLMRQLLGAVAYLHERGVIHRDLKPENLLLDSDDEGASLRIADFGACKRVATRALCGAGSPFAAFATTPCGSLGYAAPEQLRQQMYECQVDVWSAGVVAYVLLCGCMPFDPSTYAGSSFELVFPPSLFGSTSPLAVQFIHDLLQALAESGGLSGKFTHACDLWLFNCATTPVGPGSGGSNQQSAQYDPFEEPEPEVPILSLPPTHAYKRVKKNDTSEQELKLPAGAAAAEPLPAAVAPTSFSPPPSLPQTPDRSDDVANAISVRQSTTKDSRATPVLNILN